MSRNATKRATGSRTLPQTYIPESATRHDPGPDQSSSQQDTLYF